MKKLLILPAICAFAGFASADFTTTLAETSGLNTALRNAPRGYASYLDESILPTTGGPQVIIGMQLRLLGDPALNAVVGSSWPNAAINFSDFTVQVGRAATNFRTAGEFDALPSSFDAAFDPSTKVVTRSGSLSIPAGSFANDGTATTAASWGPTITFSTPFTYTPGQELVYSIFHTGYGATGTPAQAFFAVGDYANNVADAVSFIGSANGATAPGGFSSPYVVNFVTAPVPEPASMIALGMGAVALIRRRRSN